MRSRKVIWCISFVVWVFVAAVGALAATQQWIEISPQAPLPEARSFSSAVLDPNSNTMTVFAGLSSPDLHLNDVWLLSNANGLGGTPQWTNLIANGVTGSPPARYAFSAVYDSANNRMVIFGGCGGGCTPTLNDTWVLTNANGSGGTPSWMQLSPSGAPPVARNGNGVVYDEINNRMIIFGGNDGFIGGALSDVWVLTNANGLGGTPAWIQLSPSGGPPAGRQNLSAVYDSVNNIMTVFGGRNSNNMPTNAVWTLSNANGLGGTPVWTNPVPQGAPGAPPSRLTQSAVYDQTNNRMTIFGGGNNAPVVFNDAWVLSNANGLGGTPLWTKLAPTGIRPAPRETASGLYDPGTNRMIIFGGGAFDGWFNGAWVLTDANGL